MVWEPIICLSSVSGIRLNFELLEDLQQRAQRDTEKNMKLDRNKFRLGFFCLLIIFLFSSCENHFTGPGPQPIRITDDPYVAKLNVLGVMRPDSTAFPMSFVAVEMSQPFVAPGDSDVVADADVWITRRNESGDESFQFTAAVWDSSFGKIDYRNSDFVPIPGERYILRCSRDGFPDLTSETVMPFVPLIDESTIQVDEGQLSFSIRRDSLAALYDVYVLIGNEFFHERTRRPDLGDTKVIFHNAFFTGSESGTLIIYAYDLKLSEYLLFNINVKLNTFRSDYSTVENGFGCFGSLNILTKPLTRER